MSIINFAKKYAPPENQPITCADLVEYYRSSEGEKMLQPLSGEITSEPPYYLHLKEDERETTIRLALEATRLRGRGYTAGRTSEAAQHIIEKRELSNATTTKTGYYVAKIRNNSIEWAINGTNGQQYKQWFPYLNHSREDREHLIRVVSQRSITETRYDFDILNDMMIITSQIHPTLSPTAILNINNLEQKLSVNNFDKSKIRVLISPNRPIILGDINDLNRLLLNKSIPAIIFDWVDVKKEGEKIV